MNSSAALPDEVAEKIAHDEDMEIQITLLDGKVQ